MKHYQDVNDYIAQASMQNRPLLAHLRRIFQQASPKLEEAIKWNVPCFLCNGPVGGLAAYKNHVTWGLWKSRALNDPHALLGRGRQGGIMAGGKVSALAEIPPAPQLIHLIRQVIALNEAGINPATPRPEPPPDFAAALRSNDKAAAHYAAFTPARQWQYVNWITQAKRPATRADRIATAIQQISQGKTRK